MLHLRCDRTEAGFSLVELAVVVLILGLMAAILYPSYSSLFERSDRQAAVGRLQGALSYARSRAALAREPVSLVMEMDGRAFYLEGNVQDLSGAQAEIPAGFVFDHIEYPDARDEVSSGTAVIRCEANGTAENAVIVLRDADEEEPVLWLEVRPLTGRLAEREGP